MNGRGLQRRERRLVRVRELAVSGLVAGLLAAGVATVATLLDTHAAGGTASTFVPITPCRLADTRAGAGIGTRNTPLVAAETHTFAVWGTNGNCTIPASATGIVANITATGPTAGTFLTVFPADASLPNTSNLNPGAGSPPTPNQVTVALSAGGAIKIYNYAGTVDLIIDLAGYYTPAISAGQGLAPTRRSLTTVDSTGATGVFTSIAIGFDGNPIISYYDATAEDLRVAKCANPACTGAATLTTIDSTGDTGSTTSIAIGVDGNPVISYRDFTAGDLRVAKCANPACTSATLTTIDSAGNTGVFTSIAIGVDGNPIISYWDLTAEDLRVAKCANPACTGAATLTTIDSANNTGLNPSIAIGVDGNPIISYWDLTAGDLRVAKCANPACTGSATITTIDSTGDTGQDTSIAIGVDGNPIISYYDATAEDLRVAKCANPACTAATPVTVDSTFTAGLATSIAIGVDGNPIISYNDGVGDLRVAKCANPACTAGTATLTTVDTGQYTSIAIGVDGNPIISYYDFTTDDLRVAQCDNWFCATVRTRSNP